MKKAGQCCGKNVVENARLCCGKNTVETPRRCGKNIVEKAGQCCGKNVVGTQEDTRRTDLLFAHHPISAVLFLLRLSQKSLHKQKIQTDKIVY